MSRIASLSSSDISSLLSIFSLENYILGLVGWVTKTFEADLSLVFQVHMVEGQSWPSQVVEHAAPYPIFKK